MTGKKEGPVKKKNRLSTPRNTVSPKKIEPNGTSPSLHEENAIAEHKTNKAGFPIVGIGASAGGLEAFGQFFANMPPDSGMAFVLIPHLDPTHKSMMAELVQRHSKMPVVEAGEGAAVEPNHVYIIPPNRDMSILHGKLVLLEPTVERGLRHPIDFFFRALAQDQGENAICVILSGTGTEGTLGLKAVKGENGLVIAQDPKEAKYDGMPGSAVATGLVDYVVPAGKMADILLAYRKRAPKWSVEEGEKPGGKVVTQQQQQQQQQQQRIFSLIRANTGHDFSLYKQNTILRRIERRMAVNEIGNLNDYVNYLRNNTHEVDILFQELLIRVTNFFRDKDAFEVVERQVLPQITKNKSHDKPVRVWAPGCSTGEEAYSLAILLHEYAQQVKGGFKAQVFGTDIDSGAIDIARLGVYPASIAVDVSPERLSRYFIRQGNTYKIKEGIREMVVFSVQNLIKDPPFSKVDLVSCRNLLIYLGPELQKKVLPIFHYSLNPGGVLFLGSSENVGDTVDLFKVVDKKWKIFQARKLEALPPAALSSVRQVEQFNAGLRPPAGRTAPAGPGMLKINELTEKLLLNHYSPPSVMVNEKGDILFIHGRTGKYLEPAAGRASVNIIEMAREGLRLDLRSALRKAVNQKKKVRIEQLRVKSESGFEMINLDVNYIITPEHLQGLVMIVFNPAPPVKEEKGTTRKGRSEKRGEERIAEMEFELQSTKEHLRTTVEELETSNEELKSANEELQSSNEELQSTNEELETSREELQSVNEELVTSNGELQSRIDELTRANNDIANLVSSTQIATLFLNNKLRIRSFTPEMVNVFNVIQSDVGRPISDIVSKLDYPHLVRDVNEVMRTLSAKETLVLDGVNRLYLAKIMPYRTLNNAIDGVVLTFVDITVQRTAQEQLIASLAALAFNKGQIDSLEQPLLILDKDLKVLAANTSFYRTFKAPPSETERKLIYELGNRQWDIPKLRELLEKILPENAEIRDFAVEHSFPEIGFRKMRLNARRIYQEGVKTETILLAIEDVTGK